MTSLTKRNIFYALLVLVVLVVLLIVGYVIYTYGMDNKVMKKERFYPLINTSVTLSNEDPIKYFPAKKIRIYNTNVGTDYSTEGNISIAGVFVYDENGKSIPMTSITNSSPPSSTNDNPMMSSTFGDGTSNNSTLYTYASNALKIQNGNADRTLQTALTNSSNKPGYGLNIPRNNWQAYVNSTDCYVAHSHVKYTQRASNSTTTSPSYITGDYWQYDFNFKSNPNVNISAVEIIPRNDGDGNGNSSNNIIRNTNLILAITDANGVTNYSQKKSTNNYSSIIFMVGSDITDSITTTTTGATTGATTTTQPITTTGITTTTISNTTSTTLPSTTQGMTTSTSPTTSTIQGMTTSTSPTTSTTLPTTTTMYDTTPIYNTSTNSNTPYILSNINNMRTPYQAVSAKYLLLDLKGIHIAGIIVVDENGKNMFYGKNYRSIVTIPQIFIHSQQVISEPINKMFKQTVNLDYDRSKGPEYNTNLINSQIDFINSDNIFSYESDDSIKNIIFDLNYGSNEEVLVSQIILLISKDTCSNGQSCMYDNIDGNIILINGIYKTTFDLLLQNSQNPLSNVQYPEIVGNPVNIGWIYNITSPDTDNILNFEVTQFYSINEFKDTKQKTKQKSNFFDLTTSITPGYVNFKAITNFELPNSSSETNITNPITTIIQTTTTTTPPTTTNNITTPTTPTTTNNITTTTPPTTTNNITTTTKPTSKPTSTPTTTSNASVQLLPDRVIDLLNGGMNLNILSSDGIMYNPSNGGPTTNIIQTDYTGTSNIYSPYIYYNKGVSEKFAARDSDTDKKYYFYNGI